MANVVFKEYHLKQCRRSTLSKEEALVQAYSTLEDQFKGQSEVATRSLFGTSAALVLHQVLQELHQEMMDQT